MTSKKVVQAAVSVAAVAVGIALSNQIPGVKALPIEDLSPVLFEETPVNSGAFIYLSNISSTIFGEPAEDFDYHVSPDPALAIEALQSYASAVISGNTEDILTTFLNTTMAGSMTTEQSADLAWKCGELSGDMAAKVDGCTPFPAPEKRSVDHDKRALYNWIRSTAHKANKGAVQI